MRKLKSFLQYAFLTIASLVSVFPLYWMAVSATNKSTDILGGRLIPGTYLLENWKSLLEAQDVIQCIFNSFKNAIVLTVISLFICSIAGYGFEIYHGKAKDRVMAILLLAMMIPTAATLIPLFQMFSKIGLLNSTVGFILPSISTPFLILLFRQSSRSFPHDIIEAARIDGLGELNIFIKMFIPTMKSTYAAALTIIFMNAWNLYLWPKVIMLSDKEKTVPMMVANLMSGYVVDYGLVMIGVLVCTIPTVIVFFLLQKSFTEGITGAVK